MVQDIIQTIVELVCVVVCFLIGRFLIPAIKSTKSYKAVAELKEWIETYTKGIEQITTEKNAGDKKIEQVLQLATTKANELGLSLSEDDLKMMIESCVKAMNEGVKSTIQIDSSSN